MRQKLFTSLIEKRLQKQYDLGSNLKSQVVVAKIFNPYGNQTWYLLNQDPEDTDYIWAIVDMGNGIDIGSVSKSELEKIRVRPFMLPLERDMYFKEVNAEELYKGLLKGEHYAKGGVVANQYEGRSAQDVWDSLSQEQRQHFIYDHSSVIAARKNMDEDSLHNSFIRKQYKSDWANLDEDVKGSFTNHVNEGQYAKGGIIKAIKRIWKKINGTWHYNEGAGWKRDREFNNKSESYEKPNRKNYRNSKKSSK